jgi:hypothetical protein
MDKFSDLLKENSEWLGHKELKKIQKLPQRQDSLSEQMQDLYHVANHFGLYDAADYIRKNFIEK